METAAPQDVTAATPPSQPQTSPSPADAPANRKPIHCLVVDTGPLIKNDPPVSTLLAQAEEIWTIPSVLYEIRDEATRMRVETTLLPFLKQRTPRPESVKFITDFARKTGDLEVLSRPDIHLLALTYEIECARNEGDWRLRKTPTQKGVNGKPPGETTESKEEAGSPTEPLKGETKEETATQETAPGSEEVVESSPADETVAEANTGDEVTSVEEKLENLGLEPTPDAGDGNQGGGEDTPAAEGENSQGDEEEGSDSDSDGWITPSNLKKYQEKEQGGVPAQPIQQVLQAAILTSDYAMQNVALRMNLNLVSPRLARITRVKTWVLRCHGCFQVTRKMDRQFCPACGQATLTRTSCSTDQAGNFKVHLKRNYQFNKRGNVYSVPKPVHGTASGKGAHAVGGGRNGWGRDLILAEDQKEYLRRAEENRRARQRDLMDEDYLPNILTGERSGAQGRIRVGAGKNVNSKKRR